MTRAAVVRGIGGWLPPQVVTNDHLARRLGTSDEWIRTRTGITSRHVCPPGVSTSDLAVAAGVRAMRSAGTTSVDAVVLATATPDRRCPATAPLVASRLDLGPVPAFDVGAVCSGFLYALATAKGMIAAGIADRVLVIGADAFSTILEPVDRAANAIFGDGAGAVVVCAGAAGEPGALGDFDLGSDGSGEAMITIPAGGSRDPGGADRYFRMTGKAVFKGAVERMTQSSRTVLAKTGWDAPDLVVAHQANLRILHAVADQLDIPRERCAVHLDRVGNTAAASIPLALADAMPAEGTRILLTAFGGGLAWGSVTLSWPAIVNPCLEKP
jgi:3-oxoacyl-[acyl-carrier-protein] synthase III